MHNTKIGTALVVDDYSQICFEILHEDSLFIRFEDFFKFRTLSVLKVQLGTTSKGRLNFETEILMALF